MIQIWLQFSPGGEASTVNAQNIAVRKYPQVQRSHIDDKAIYFQESPRE
jgi:hypothetical protein